MDRPSYLTNYVFDWEQFDVILGGKSALDSHSFLTPMTSLDKVEDFLKSYGFRQSDPILKAELFGYFQEAMQFIKRYFLKSGNQNGLPIEIPSTFNLIHDISDLFLMASGSDTRYNFEDCLWAAVILKVMHTIIHADKDLRSNYFSVIQQQIFDRYYKVIHRNEENQLFLRKKGGVHIPLVEFSTKAKKTRDSTIIKMLHKVENVAEELFDRVGVRFVTHSKVDTLRVIKFLQENNIVMAHNIKPSRSYNSIIDLETYRKKHLAMLKMCMRNNLSEERFLHALERELSESEPSIKKGPKNEHSSKHYRSIQFTCRQLIIFKNPIVTQLSKIKKMAKEEDQNNSLVKEIKSIDMSLVSRDVRFFYPYEVQVVDKANNDHNTEGDASHEEYKQSQLITAMKRVFRDIINYKNL